MKYTININQLALAKTGLDIVDAAILDYLYVYCNSRNEKIEAQRVDGWTWINYSALIEDMPLLGIKSPGAITPRIKKLERAGFISTNRLKHQKLFMKMNSQVDELFIETNSRPGGAIHQNEQSYSPSRTNNNTTDDNTIEPPTISKRNLEDLRLATLLHQLVVENYPFAAKKITAKYLNSEAEEINRLARIDGRDYKLIEFMITWACNDSFWKQNIRSAAKLRKQFENLMIKAKTEMDNHKERVAVI